MLVKVGWRVLALLVIMFAELEVFSWGRALMNMPYDVATFGGVVLIAISLFVAARLIVSLFPLPKGDL